MIDFLLQLRAVISSRTAKDTSTIFVGNIASSILGIGFTILAARALGPENWGVVAAVASLIIILAALGDLGLGASIFRFISGKWGSGDSSEAERTYRVIFSLRIITAVVFAITLLFLAPWVSKNLLNREDPSLIFLGVVGFLGVLLLDFQIVTFQARQNWRTAAVFTSLTNLVRVALVLLLMSIDRISPLFVLSAFVVSPLLVWIFSFFWRPTVPVGADWRGVTRKIATFSSWMAGNRIVSATNSRVDMLILIRLAGAHTTGIYAAANQLAFGVPLLVGSFATVLAPQFAALQGENLKDFFKKAIGLSLVIVLFLIAGIIFSQPIISLFGPDYKASAPVLRWLLVAFIPFALSAPAVNILIYHFERPRIITLTSLIQIPVTLSLNILLIPKIGVFAPVLVLGLVNFSTMIVTYIFALRYLKK